LESILCTHTLPPNKIYAGALSSSHSRHMVVRTQIQNKQVTLAQQAMIDSGATSSFINQRYVTAHNIPTIPREFTMPVKDVDGRHLAVVDRQVRATLRVGQHQEEILLDVVPTGKYPIILGMTWLQHHNPTINWPQHRMVFSSPYCATNCLDAPPDILGQTGGDEQFLNTFGELLAVELTEEEERRRARNISADIAARSKKDERKRTLEEMVPKEYHDYLDVFGEEGAAQLPPHREWDMKIDFKEGAILPKPSGLYPMSDAENKNLREWLDEMLGKGFIQPSKSPVASACFFVPKKDSKDRLVIDYRKINDITIPDQYPLPRTDEIIDRFRGMKWFSKMDLRWGYNLVRIADGDEWKTAFRTRYGLFEFKVMSFGLRNAPAVFQRMMNSTLAPVLDINASAFIDDIASYAEEFLKHVRVNRQILQILRENGLYLRPEKCDWHKQEIEYMGVRAGVNGTRMEEGKVEAIMEWKVPRNVTEVRSFLGFLNFYC
jgi:hypothetical protein